MSLKNKMKSVIFKDMPSFYDWMTANDKSTKIRVPKQLLMQNLERKGYQNNFQEHDFLRDLKIPPFFSAT